jgi:alpha-1,2-mannosyltransferase
VLPFAPAWTGIQTRMSRQSLRAAALAMAVTLLAVHGWDVAVPGLLDRTGRLKCPDFLQFYTYGTLFSSGQSGALYVGEAHARVARERIDPRMTLTGFRPNYSPIVAWLMAPLSTLPYLRAMALWTAISVALYFLAVVLLAPAAPHASVDRLTLYLVAAAWPALFGVLRYGQLSAMSLLLVAAAARFSSQGRSIASGVALGLLVYKPNLLVAPVLILAFAGEWRLLGGLAAGAGLETLVSLLSVGPKVFADYLTVLLTLARHPDLVQMFPQESHSASGAARLLVPWPFMGPIVSVLALGLCTWAGARVWKATTDIRPRWAALVLGSLLASPHLLTYDLLLLAIPLLLLADWRWELDGRWPEGLWLAPLVLMYAGSWPGTLFARVFSLQISTIGMGLALVLLFQQTHHQLVRPQPEHDVVDGPSA